MIENEQSDAQQANGADASNPPGQGICSACQFPAIATAREISHARPQLDPGSVIVSTRPEPGITDEISKFPKAQQAVAILLLGLCFVGLVMLKALVSFEGTIAGLLLAVIAGALLVLILPKHEKSKTNRQ